MSVNLDRARILLFEQSRYDLAEKLLRQEIGTDPSNSYTHALLALCLAGQERSEEATREAKEAIRLAPDYAYAHYVLAKVLVDRNKLKEAKAVIEEAIRLDPEHADYLALLSAIEHNQNRYPEALAAAERALGVDPQHTYSANLRTMALMQIGRRREAETMNTTALAGAPQDALAHANRGWLRLHRSDISGALQSFQEALRLSPEHEWARKGLIEALKAKHRVYRLILPYLLLGGWARAGVLFGAGVGYVFSLVFIVGGFYPRLTVLLWCVLAICASFIMLAYMADTLFNLILWLQPSGRLILSPADGTPRTWRDSVYVLVKTVWMVGCVLLALLAFTVFLLTLNLIPLLLGMLFRWFADAALKENRLR